MIRSKPLNGWVLLFLLFLTLKLTHIIDWAWLWVFAPLWGPWVFGMVIWITAMVVVIILERRR